MRDLLCLSLDSSCYCPFIILDYTKIELRTVDHPSGEYQMVTRRDKRKLTMKNIDFAWAT